MKRSLLYFMQLDQDGAGIRFDEGERELEFVLRQFGESMRPATSTSVASWRSARNSAAASWGVAASVRNLADLTVWSTQFGSAPAALAAAESAQAAALLAPLMAAEDSTLPPSMLTPTTLTSQLVDAAMATPLYAATPAAHRNGWSAAAHHRRHQAIARSAVVIPKVLASVGMPRARTLPTYLNDAEEK